MYFFVSKRRDRCDVVTVLYRGYPSCVHAAANCFVLSAAHKKRELKILLVKLIVWIVGLYRGDYFCPGSFKGLCYNALIYGVTAGKTLDFHDKNSVVLSVVHIRKKCLHLRTCGYVFTADDLPVLLHNRKGKSFSKLRKGFFMLGKSLSFASCLSFHIGT